MIIDFEESKTDSFHADLCIIGAGIATYSILSALSDTDLRIIVLERGTNSSDTSGTLVKACEITQHPFQGHLEGRHFGVGGTSETWGGQALVFNAFDLSKKDWVDNSGWPISIEEISMYYSDAEKLLNLTDVSYASSLHQLQRLPKLGFNGEYFTNHFSKWSPSPNLKHAMLNLCRASKNITLLLNACCDSIVKSCDSDNVQEVRIKSAKNQRGKVNATKYILAAGGIENPRILLLSPSLITHHTMVGKMFQDHPTAQVATVYPENERKFQQHFNYFFRGRTRILPRLSLSTNLQAGEKLLAATGFIQFISPPNGLFEASKTLYRAMMRIKLPTRKEIAKLLYSLKEVNTLSKMAIPYLFRRRIYTPHGIPRLTIMLEQEPVRESYISLSEDLDSYGMPKAKINWHITQATISTMKRFCTLIEAEFARLNLGKIKWDSWLDRGDKEIQNHLIDAYHHMGATRMSQSISNGVVDENCKMHEVSNLYVAGSSVFPTSGHSNPTLTIMALAIRLANHLKTDLAK